MGVDSTGRADRGRTRPFCDGLFSPERCPSFQAPWLGHELRRRSVRQARLKSRLRTPATLITCSSAFLLRHEASIFALVIHLYLTLATFLQHFENTFSGARIDHSSREARATQLLKTGNFLFWSRNPHRDVTPRTLSVSRTEDTFLLEAVPLDRGQDSHCRGPGLLDRVVSLWRNCKPSHGTRCFASERQPPVRRNNSMVGSGQPLPQLFSGVPNGSRPPLVRRGALGFPDVTPHEEIPRAEEQRVTRQRFPVIRPGAGESLPEVSFRLEFWMHASNPRSAPCRHRHVCHSLAAKPVPESGPDAKSRRKIAAQTGGKWRRLHRGKRNYDD